MYGWIWRILPGPRWLKAIEALVLLALVVMALITWVYPWMSTVIDVDPNLG